ncbi:MAG: hypothetical protein AABM43_09905 [Actinomycetota bacterium]
MELNRAQLVPFAAGVLVGVAVVLLVLLIKGNSGDARSAGLQVITIKDGKPVDGVKELAYDLGDKMRIRIDSDVTDLVNIHPYDVTKQVTAGGSVRRIWTRRWPSRPRCSWSTSTSRSPRSR